MHTMVTPLINVWSKKADTNTPNFVALTPGLNTTFIKEVRFARWLEAVTPAFTAAIGYQMSDDDNDWSTNAPTVVGSYSATAGWTYDTATNPTSVTTDQRLFVRFGIMCANSSGSDVQQALARLRMQFKPVEGATLAADRVKVFTQGSTTSEIFHPMLGPVPIEAVGEVRGTIRLSGSTGALSVQPAYQVSNDALSWDSGANGASADSFGLIEGARTSNGNTYGTTFTSFGPTNRKRLVRFGVAAKNTSGTIKETGLVSVRVDYRRTT